MTSVAQKLRLAAGLAAGCLAALAITSDRVAAQGEPQPSIRIAVPDSFPSADVSVLVVRTGALPRTPTVLVNKHDLTPETIAAAIAAAHLAIRGAIRREETQVTGVARFSRPAPMKASTRQLATKYLHQLQAQPTTRIGNLGAGRWIEVPPPTR